MATGSADWKMLAEDTLWKINKYVADLDSWKLSKDLDDVKVWEKPSPDWDGMLYKVEGNFNASPDLVFKYVDPVPSGPRSKWDHAIKELQEVERFNPDLAVIRTITKNAFGGLISPRDFTDLVVNVKDDKYLSTNAQAVEHPSCPPCSDFVRGTNHPCAIICYRIPGEPQKTRVVSYIQTDLSGMLPKTLVENALPSNQVDFFVTLKKILQDDGHWMN